MTISDLCVQNSDNKMRHFQTSRHSPLNRKVSLFRGLCGRDALWPEQWRTTKVNDWGHVTLTPLPHEAALFRNRFAFESVKDVALCQAQYVRMLLFEYLAFSRSSLQSYLHNSHTATGCCIHLHLTLGSEPRSTKWFSISCIFFFFSVRNWDFFFFFFFFSYKSTPNYKRQKIIAALLHDDYRATVCEHMLSTVINTRCHFNSGYNRSSFTAAGRMFCCQQLLSLYTSHMTRCVSFLVDDCCLANTCSLFSGGQFCSPFSMELFPTFFLWCYSLIHRNRFICLYVYMPPEKWIFFVSPPTSTA